MIQNLDLTDEQILNIVAYIDQPEPATAAVTGGEVNEFGTDLSKIERPVVEQPNIKVLSWNDYTFWFASVVLIVGIIALLYFGIAMDVVIREERKKA